MGKPSLEFLFRDLTQLGLPKSQFSLVNDETAYKYNPDRYNFYMQLLDDVADPKQKIASKVFGVLTRTRRQHERIKEKIDNIAQAIGYLKSNYTKPDTVGQPREYGELAVLKNDLNARLKRMPIVGKYYEFDTDLKKGPTSQTEKAEFSEKATASINGKAAEKDTGKTGPAEGGPAVGGPAVGGPAVGEGGKREGGYSEIIENDAKTGGSWYGDRLNELKDVEKQKYSNKREREEAEDDVLLEYKNHPIYSPENQKVTYSDRLVFIAVTFMFRAITLFMIDWGINTKVIKGFQTGFLYYFIIYSILFSIWVLLVNIRKQNLFIGMMFYYINANYDKTVWKRIIIHISMQLLILPVPLIVTDKKSTGASENDTFEKRERMLSTLNLFTFIIWVLTSAIALRA